MNRRHWLGLALAAGAIASPYAGLLPGWTPALATTVALTGLGLLGLNIIFGVVGMLAFGQAAFMALPGYGTGVLEHAGVPFVLAVAISLAGTVLIARLVAEVFVRLPGIYLAVGTLGFGFAVEGLARAFPSWTGGASGLVFSRGREIGAGTWYVISLVALLTGLALYVGFMRGALWRRLRTVRHDELAAGVLGIDVGRAKAWAFTIGSAYAVAAGILLAFYVGVLVPEDAGVNRSLEQVGTVLLGGLGYAAGPIVGSFVVQWLFFAAGYGARYELLIYGVCFLGAVIYARNGIVGAIEGPWLRLTQGLAPPLPARRASPIVAATPAAAPERRSGTCLTVANLSKRFGGVKALDDVSFTLDHGEILAMVGPNGAGKSTLFNIVSGIEAATEGTLRLRGTDLAALPVHRRAPYIGRSFQVARLVPELTALANVMVRLDQVAGGLSETDREAVALAQLENFGLLDLADLPVRTLSLGQHKLIDLARAAVGDPPLVLLDEPAVGLSEDELEHLATLLATLRARGSAILIVEHNIEFVSRIAERGIVLDSGRMIAAGPMREILADAKVREAYFGVLT